MPPEAAGRRKGPGGRSDAATGSNLEGASVTMESDFWQYFAFFLVGLIVLSIVLAALCAYLFKDRS
jgi:hypothetical protein